MDVSIIIVNYNTKDLTLACINSVFEYTKELIFEVILVDNNSTDGSVELFRTDSRIIFLESKENLGFGKANNLGYKRARGKYIFLLNSDTLLLNNSVSLFYDKMENLSEGISCIGCLLTNSNLETIHSYGKFPTLFLELIYRSLNIFLKKTNIKYYHDSPRAINNGDFEVDYITGADMFIRKNVIEECGFFDPAYFMYYEETDLQYRFYKAGYKQMIVHGPQIIHFFGGSSQETRVAFALNKRVGALRSSFIYLKKHNNLFLYVLYRMLLFLFSVPIIFFNKYGFYDRIKYLRALIYL